MLLNDREEAIVLEALQRQADLGPMVIRFVVHPAYPPQARTIEPEEMAGICDKIRRGN